MWYHPFWCHPPLLLQRYHCDGPFQYLQGDIWKIYQQRINRIVSSSLDCIQNFKAMFRYQRWWHILISVRYDQYATKTKKSITGLFNLQLKISLALLHHWNQAIFQASPHLGIVYHPFGSQHRSRHIKLIQLVSKNFSPVINAFGSCSRCSRGSGWEKDPLNRSE